MRLEIPDFCLVVLIGTSGSGKSMFAAKHFKPTEIVSSDAARGVVSDDETDQDATGDAFDLVHYIIRTRLSRRRLTVVDATNVRPEDRAALVRIARENHALAVALVLNPGEDICQARNVDRPERQFGPHVVRNQTRTMKRGLRGLDKEGFRQSHEFRSVEKIEAVEIVRVPLWADRRSEHGPFDIIGDVHGCAGELIALFEKMGYSVALNGEGDNRTVTSSTPQGRRAVFVGDLVDRGPRSPDVLRIAMHMAEHGQAICVPGNHDIKLLRWLMGRNVKLTHGLAETVEQLSHEPEAFKKTVQKFLDKLVSHAWLEGGTLAVAHAGIKEDMLGRASGKIREFCLYGETSGETDEFGLPVRYNWAAEYRGAATIVYGHTPVPEAEWLNNTLCVDTGCVFGGKLTALRWPEREIVSVPALKTHVEPIRPLSHPPARPGASLTAQALYDDLLNLEDVTGKRIVSTRLGRSVQVHEANAAAALEVMARFAVDPKWLIYLPPTMSPSETSQVEGYLERPEEAFGYFEKQGVQSVVVEDKHMGSRAVAVVCRDRDVALRRFGVANGQTGAIYTRTGRPFFSDPVMTDGLLARLRQGVTDAGLWDLLETDWVLLDAELMPWSAKAQDLIRQQYAATGSAARAGLTKATALFHQAEARGLETGDAAARFHERAKRSELFAEAYRHYCWPVTSLDDYRFAPFHLLASEGAVHTDKDHVWHMDMVGRLAIGGDPVLMRTDHRVVSLSESAERTSAAAWWDERTQNGSEGMVVKPRDFIVRGPKGMVQPALKCRGKSYLRIIYGPEYDVPRNLERLRKRGLGLKRSLALREFVLGHEGLNRFIDREPLRRVHECVFAVLALESEPVDPRL
ncbi:MAG: polynucleotide kinase-phosphatase [Pseudomonadota bacterium]